jgi:hypothetical protein
LINQEKQLPADYADFRRLNNTKQWFEFPPNG